MKYLSLLPPPPKGRKFCQQLKHIIIIRRNKHILDKYYNDPSVNLRNEQIAISKYYFSKTRYVITAILLVQIFQNSGGLTLFRDLNGEN